METGVAIRDYILEERIGGGGVGDVWRARHGHLDKVVAIKVIHRHLAQDTQFYERFLHEAMAMAKFDHPHIVGVHDFFFLDDESYLVMSYIEGESLQDLIEKRGRLPVDEAIRISRDVLDALDFAHRKGVIHRDVKPSNILVRPDGSACLVDFGIALVVGKQRVTRFGATIGTPEYMSPEQIKTSKSLDHRTDVYSFGCVLYEMLTGRPPFGSQDVDGLTDYTIMHRHMNEKPAPLRPLNPEVDGKTEAVVLRALAKEPDQRFGGCEEMAVALPTPQGPEVGPASVGRPPAAGNGKKSTVLLAMVIVLALSTAITSSGWVYYAFFVKSPAQLENTRAQLKKARQDVKEAQDHQAAANRSLANLGKELQTTEEELEKCKQDLGPQSLIHDEDRGRSITKADVADVVNPRASVLGAGSHRIHAASRLPRAQRPREPWRPTPAMSLRIR